ncbi:MAG: hypothetical protein ABL930_01320 [Pseudobdellovibrio sp.]
MIFRVLSYCFLITFCFSASLFAEELMINSIGVKAELIKTENISKSGKTILWQFSDAKAPHLIQGFNLEGKLVLEKYDNDENNIFEKVIETKLKEKVSIEQYDENQDGKFEKIRKLSSQGSDLTITTSVLNINGQFEIISETKISMKEALSLPDVCDSDPSKNEIFKKIKAFKPLMEESFISKTEGAYSITSFGPAVHESCLKKFGKEFPSLLQSTLRNGLNCLSRLDGPGSRENLTKIASILENKQNPLKLRCNVPIHDGALAMAKIPGQEGFPGIDFSPTEKFEEKNLRGLIFHELLHNCGHLHVPEDVEYMYACPNCCEDKPINKDRASCKICRGDFRNTNTFEYQLAYSQTLYSAGVDKISAQILSGKFAGRKDAPFLFLSSIQYSPDNKDIYDQMYSYYKSKGFMTPENSSYLRAPNRAVPISQEVKALADAFSNAVPTNKLKALEPVIANVDRVLLLPKTSALFENYNMIIQGLWSENLSRLEKNKNDQQLKNQDLVFRNLVQKFQQKK